MKRLILILVLALAYTQAGVCQCLTLNLIKNPSFEEYNCCPTNMGMIYCANDWTQPLATSTSDYFNVCAIDSLDNPGILPYYQQSYFGNGYAGILCDHYTNPFIYREYLQGTLTEPLVANKCYFMKFWVLLSSYGSTHALDALGVFFSDTLPKDISVNYPFYYSTQISNPTGRIISDTINWTRIEGTFKAVGGEKYITIGTFKYEIEINKSEIKPPPLGTDYSCYFFDNFSLCPCEDTIPSDTIKPIEPELEVYPNPANENLFILFDGYNQIQTIDLEIYNVLGELVMNKQIVSNPEPSSVPITSIASGCYILVLKNGSSILYKDKLIVIK